jgi:glycerol-3-phosphate dehydrogenase
MGEKAVDRARPLLSSQGVAVAPAATRHRPLPGKPPSPMAEWQIHLLGLRELANPGLTEDAVAHLAYRHGRRASEVLGLTTEDRSLGRPIVEGLPDIDAEIVFAAREEDARSASDVLIRRTHLFWQAPDQGLACVERVGDLLGRELAWSRSEIRASVAAYEKEVARSRAWRASSPPEG